MRTAYADEQLSDWEALTEEEQVAESVLANQRYLNTHLRKSYNFVVCGSGSSGSVVVRRRAENPAVSVLLIEAGGRDEVPTVSFAGQWAANLRSNRDWAFHAEANTRLSERSIPLNAGTLLGGGLQPHVMIRSRVHATDWDFLRRKRRSGMKLRICFEHLSTDRGLA